MSVPKTYHVMLYTGEGEEILEWEHCTSVSYLTRGSGVVTKITNANGKIDTVLGGIIVVMEE